MSAYNLTNTASNVIAESTSYFLDPQVQTNVATNSTNVDGQTVERIWWNVADKTDPNIVYNPTTATFNLKTGGRYRVTYQVNARYNATTTYQSGVFNYTTNQYEQVSYHNTQTTIQADQIVAGHRKVVGTAIIDTTAGARNIGIAFTGGFGTWASYWDATVFAPSLSNAQMAKWNNITIEKISGFTPVTGQSVDVVSVNLTGSNFSIPAINADVIFNTLAFGNIPYNTSTGVFTLTANKTYELQATLKSRGTGAGYVQYEWVDGVTGVSITGGTNGLDMQAPSTLIEGSSSRAYLMYTPSTNQTVKIRVTGVTGTAIQLDAQRCNANIKQIGSSVTTAITRVNVICRNKTVQSLGGLTWTNLTNWTVVQDPTSSFNAVTGVFTTPRTGTYQFSTGNATPSVLVTNYVGQSVFKNGTIQLYNFLVGAGSSAIQYISTNGTIEMNAGDTLQARTYNGGATGNDTPSPGNSWFTITEINPTF